MTTDGCPGALLPPERLDDLEPGGAGHLRVREGEVWLLGAGRRERVRPRRAHPTTIAIEDLAERWGRGRTGAG